MRLILALVVLLSTSAFACDDKGKVETKRYDSLGNYTVKDNRGNTTICRVDSLKNVTCKTK